MGLSQNCYRYDDNNEKVGDNEKRITPLRGMAIHLRPLLSHSVKCEGFHACNTSSNPWIYRLRIPWNPCQGIASLGI